MRPPRSRFRVTLTVRLDVCVDDVVLARARALFGLSPEEAVAHLARWPTVPLTSLKGFECFDKRALRIERRLLRNRDIVVAVHDDPRTEPKEKENPECP
jgi:hypothetical protein